MVTGIVVTGMTKRMPGSNKLENVYTILLMAILLFKCLDFLLFAAFNVLKKDG